MVPDSPKPIHSPLGASSAERWIHCPGSVALLKQLTILETSDEPEYSAQGIAAHELAAHCLKSGVDAWELIGEKFHEIEVDKEMADAVQTYLETVRQALRKTGAKLYIEYGISHPSHALFYGTLDSAVVYEEEIEHDGPYYKYIADINDYKHGQGIVVEVKDNPQLMYYALGFLREHPEVELVRLRIVQPRTFSEPVKETFMLASDIKKWAEEVLIPAMLLAEMDHGDLDAGNWCRFCPAKLVCPLMNNLFEAAMNTNPQQKVELTNASLGRSYGYIEAVKFYIKSLEEEVYNRLNRGGVVPGCKLVPKKANRIFKPEAPALAAEMFGEDAYSKPELKSPSEIDRLGKRGKDFTREYAFTPQTGLTVARENDNRVGVKMQTSSQAFGQAVKDLDTNQISV